MFFFKEPSLRNKWAYLVKLTRDSFLGINVA